MNSYINYYFLNRFVCRSGSDGVCGGGCVFGVGGGSRVEIW